MPEIPTIADLFAKDPLSLTKEDRSQIIAYYRENRDKYLSTGKGTIAKEPKQKSKGPLPDINLDDLEL